MLAYTKSHGLAPITQHTRVGNKNGNTQGSSPNMVKVIFHALREQIFPLREVPISKRDIIVENHCLIQ